MLCAMLSTVLPVAVVTGNEWVSKGVNLLLEARNNDGEARLSQFHGSHCEVWVEIRRRILERPAGWMTVRHVYGHASVTDVCSGRFASKGTQMNQRADRLEDNGAEFGAPSRLALTRFQDRAKMVPITQRMAVRLVGARDHLDDIASQACNSNVEAGAIHETQSKRWYRPMLRNQTRDGRTKSKKMQISTQLVRPNDRDDLAETLLRQRDHTGLALLPCKWIFPRLCEVKEAPHSWSAESLAVFRAKKEGRPTFAVGKPTEVAEFAAHTSWLTLAVDMQLVTGISLQRAGLLVAHARTFDKMWRHFSIFLEKKTVRSCF